MMKGAGLFLIIYFSVLPLTWGDGFTGAGAGLEITAGDPTVYSPSFWLQSGFHGFKAVNDKLSFYGDGYAKGIYAPLGGEIDGILFTEGAVSYRTDKYYFNAKPSVYTELSNTASLPYIYTSAEIFNALYFNRLSVFLSPVFFFELDETGRIGGSASAGISSDIIPRSVLTCSMKGEISFELSTGVHAWYAGPELKLAFYPGVPLTFSTVTSVLWNRSNELQQLVPGGDLLPAGNYLSLNEQLDFSLFLGRNVTLKSTVPVTVQIMQYGYIENGAVMDLPEINLQLKPSLEINFSLGKHWQIVPSVSLCWEWSNTVSRRSFSTDISLEGYVNF